MFAQTTGIQLLEQRRLRLVRRFEEDFPEPEPLVKERPGRRRLGSGLVRAVSLRDHVIDGAEEVQQHQIASRVRLCDLATIQEAVAA